MVISVHLCGFQTVGIGEPETVGFGTIPVRSGLKRSPVTEGGIDMRLRTLFLVAVATLVISGAAGAASFTQVVVLGDSLSDNGNLFAATGIPPAPYYQGRRSDGPVAVEYLAQRIGAPLLDLAWIGATTGIGNYGDGGSPDSFGAFNLPGMTTVFQQTFVLNALPVDPNALYVVWGGSNDFFGLTNPADAGLFISRAITNILTLVGSLQSLGAQHFLVPNLPDLGRTPEALADPAVSFFLTSVSAQFNGTLHSALPAGVRYFDTFGIMTDILADPAKYGLTNVTSSCFDGTTVCSDPSQYLFWDNVHPTTVGHGILGNAMADAVPEPSSVILMLTGLGILTAAGLRRR